MGNIQVIHQAAFATQSARDELAATIDTGFRNLKRLTAANFQRHRRGLMSQHGLTLAAQTQVAVADAADLNLPQFRRLRRGRVPQLAIDKFEKLFLVLDIPLDAFESRVTRRQYHRLVAKQLFDDPDCLAFLAKRHEDPYLVARQRNVELRLFVTRTPMSPEQNGVPFERVHIRNQGLPIRSDEDLHDPDVYARLVERKAHNGGKLGLIGIEPSSDIYDHRDDDLVLDVGTTNYYAQVMAVTKLINDQSLRHRLMSSTPRLNHVPNSLCLHFVVRFADGPFWVLHRNDHVGFDRDRVSLSGEEQITVSDQTAADWSIRALMEEVFPYRGFSLTSHEADRVRQSCAWSRILSLALEERYANYAICAYFQLSMTSSEYVALLRRERRERDLKLDGEGRVYLLEPTELRKFLFEGRASLVPLEADQERVEIVPDDFEASGPEKKLHGSSLYRMHLVRLLLNDNVA